MKILRKAALAALVAAVMIPAAHTGFGEGVEVVIGELFYAPKPDVSICFCGSFRLCGEGGPKELYLVAEAIDLGQYVGQRIAVHGRAYSGLCSGTLARPCSYFWVEKVVVLARTGSETASWGAVKAIYR